MARKQKKYHYIYKTINLLNGKFYIGMHSTDNLEDGYIGSGKRLRYSINKHGRENHKCEILEFLPNRKDLRKREAELVNEDLLKNSLCMNLKYGGEGGFEFINKNSKAVSIQNQNVDAVARGRASARTKKLRALDEEYRKEYSLKISEGIKKFIQKNGAVWSGRSHSEETKRKMSESAKGKQDGEKNSQFGTCWIMRDDLERPIKIKKEELNLYLSDGYRQGRK